MKRFVRFFLLASTLALFMTMKQASAMQSPPSSANPVQPQAANQASAHDRHNRKHSSGKRHHHHRKAATKH